MLAHEKGWLESFVLQIKSFSTQFIISRVTSGAEVKSNGSFLPHLRGPEVWTSNSLLTSLSLITPIQTPSFGNTNTYNTDGAEIIYKYI